MAVAAADFYTYSKATGTPLPKSKQEEAQLTPAVNQWKKSRTRAPESVENQNDIGDDVGKGLIGAALAGAALYGYRRGWGDTPGRPVDGPTPKGSPSPSSIRRDLPNVDEVTGLADTTFIPSPITPKDSRGVNLVGTRNPKTGTYRASVNEIQDQSQATTVVPEVRQQPQVTPEEALDAYRQKWINEHSTSKATIGDIQEGIRQKKLATGDKEISPGFFESDARRQEQEIARRGFNETDLPPPQDQPAPGAPSPDDPASYSRKYIESTGAIEPNTKQYDYQAGPMPPKIDPDDVVEQVDGVTSFNPWAADHEEIAREQAVDVASGKIPGGVIDKSRDPVSGYTYEDIQNKLLEQARPTRDVFAPDTLVQKQQQPSVTTQLSDQSLESANSGYAQMDDALDRRVQRDTDSVAIGKQNVENQVIKEKIVEEFKTTPVPIVNNQQTYTTKPRTEGFYTRPQNLSTEARQGALSQLNVDNTGSQYPAGGTFLREYTTPGSRIAGDINVQRGAVTQGQLELPIVYSTRGRINPTLRTQLVNEGPTYTSVDEYIARYEPVPPADVQLGPSSAFLTDEQLNLQTKKARAIADLGQREEELIKSGLRPGTTRFDNARALGWTNKQYTPISITNRQFQETASMPKSLREVLEETPGRVFYETTSEGQIIPETVEIRGERPEVMKYPTGKGGGGRKVAESVSPPDNPLDTLIVQKQVMPTGAQTRPVQDTIQPDLLTQTGGLELSSPIYANTDQTGRVIGPYGIEKTSALNPEYQNRPQAITSIAPSASPGSWTPAAGRARSENVNIVISGGRDYTNYPEFVQKTDQIIREMNIPANKKITIVEGGAKGADKLAERYARERGYGLVVKPADWSKGGTLKYPEYDKSAGPRRNIEMAEMGDVGIAFPGGKGTSNFVRTMAREKGKPVYYASEIQQATPEGRRAMAASEEIRKIYSSGRPDAQQQVANYIQQLRQKGI